jgi:hypothetical protein
MHCAIKDLENLKKLICFLVFTCRHKVEVEGVHHYVCFSIRFLFYIFKYIATFYCLYNQIIK